MAKPFQDCVVLLGDSMTSRQEFPNNLHARMADAYKRSYDVLNRGFGGYNSTWFLPLMDHIFAKTEDAGTVPAVRLVTIWLGVNDSAMDRKHVPVSVFRKNMEEILDRLTSPSSPYAIAHSDYPVSIILITPGGVQDSMRDDPHHVLAAESKKYSDAVLDIGQEWAQKNKEGNNWKIGTIDLYGAILKAGELGGRERFYSDGVHFSTAGYDLLWAEIDKLVHTEFKGRGIDWNDQDDCPWTAPDWVHPAEGGPERLIELLKTKPYSS